MPTATSSRHRDLLPALRRGDHLHLDAIDVLERGGVHHRVGRALGQYLATVECYQPIAVTRCQIDVVQHDDDAQPQGVAQVRDQLHHLDLMGDVQRRQRLVQQQIATALGQQHREPYTLTFATGEGIDLLVGEGFGVGQRDGALDGFFILGAGTAEQAVPRITAEGDQFAAGQRFGRRQVLGQVGHRPREFPAAELREWAIVQRQLATGRRVLARQQLEQCRLAGAIAADQRDATRQQILDSNPDTIGGLGVTGLDTTDGFKFSLADGGWLLIRFSGTEPIIRVYCETTDQNRVQSILEDGLRIAGLQA